MTVTEAVNHIFVKMQEHGVTDTRLAREAGISRMTLGNWKSGRGEPSFSHYLKVRDALDRLVTDQ